MDDEAGPDRMCGRASTKFCLLQTLYTYHLSEYIIAVVTVDRRRFAVALGALVTIVTVCVVCTWIHSDFHRILDFICIAKSLLKFNIYLARQSLLGNTDPLIMFRSSQRM